MQQSTNIICDGSASLKLEKSRVPCSCAFFFAPSTGISFSPSTPAKVSVMFAPQIQLTRWQRVHNHCYGSAFADLPSCSGKGLCYLCESTIKAPGILMHVAFQKTNATMINPIGHPNACNCGLLVPVDLNLHPSKTHQSILLHHHPTHVMLLARAAAPPFSIPTTLTTMPDGCIC
jgi:hypothetical protein